MVGDKRIYLIRIKYNSLDVFIFFVIDMFISFIIVNEVKFGNI